MHIWGVRNEVCEYADLRKGGLGTLKTEEDVRSENHLGRHDGLPS